jgi:hypothetical protein
MPLVLATELKNGNLSCNIIQHTPSSEKECEEKK